MTLSLSRCNLLETLMLLYTLFFSQEFVAGEIVEGVIGLTNTNTEKEFIVTLIEGSFR